MSRDSVRYGRVPKRSRDAAPETPEQRSGPNPAPAEEVDPETLRQGVIRELVKMVTSAHRLTNPYTEEKRATLKQRMITMTDSGTEEDGASSTTGKAADVRSVLWGSIAKTMCPAVQQVVEFAKRLPGFISLPQDDQLILIKVGFFEVWLTRATKYSKPDLVVFDCGTILTRDQLAIMYDPPFANAIMNYLYAVTQLKLSEDEMGTFTGSLLMWPYRAGLSDRDTIAALHQAIGDAFRYIVLNSGPEGAARLEALWAAAHEVRQMGARHNDLLNWCREHWPRLALPALFAEIFDIPKCDEDEAHNVSELASVPAAPQA